VRKAHHEERERWSRESGRGGEEAREGGLKIVSEVGKLNVSILNVSGK